MNITIRPCHPLEFRDAPNFDALMASYMAESGVVEMGEPNPQWDRYAELTDLGVMFSRGAWVDDTLVGMSVAILANVPHFGIPFVTVETFYVDPAYRSGGIGLKLLRSIEDAARDLGVKHLMATAPVDSVLSKVLPRRGYRETNRVYLRMLGDA